MTSLFTFMKEKVRECWSSSSAPSICRRFTWLWYEHMTDSRRQRHIWEMHTEIEGGRGVGEGQEGDLVNVSVLQKYSVSEWGKGQCPLCSVWCSPLDATDLRALAFTLIAIVSLGTIKVHWRDTIHTNCNRIMMLRTRHVHADADAVIIAFTQAETVID